MLAKAVGQLVSMLDVLPPSRASSLPQYFETTSKFLPTANPCGSELARDGGSAANREVDPNTAFKSPILKETQ